MALFILQAVWIGGGRLAAADSADAILPTSIVFTWADTHTDETGYRIERALAAEGPFVVMQTLPADTDVWTDPSLLPSTTYYYRAVPLLAGGDGPVGDPAAATTLALGDSTGRMQQNTTNYWRAIGASRKNPRMIEALANVDTRAAEALATLQPNGSWPDINYADLAPASGWPIANHYNRLLDLARAWATPGAALHGDAALLTKALQAIDYIETIVNSSTSLSGGNWWWWQIGVPERYGPALLLLRAELGASRLAASAATLDYLVGPALREGTTGVQNKVWHGTTRLYHGLLTGASASISTGANLLAEQVAFAAPGAEGIAPDYSFLAHGVTTGGVFRQQLLTGQYGASYMQYVPQFTFFAEGTSYQLTPEKQNILATYALESARWIVNGRFTDISSEGRAYTRVGVTSQPILGGLLALAAGPESPTQTTAAATAKALLANWSIALLPELAGLAARVEALPLTPALPLGFRAFNHSDYALWRAASAFVSLKTISTRTLIGELVNNENKRGRHLASGVTWINLADEYRINNVIPTLDHGRLPGTTIEYGVATNSSGTFNKVAGLRSFVGTATTGTAGVTAMDFQSRASGTDSNLTAKKSWFFFGDSFVALGSDITGGPISTARNVETIINQRPLSALAAPIIVNGNAVSTTATNSTTFANTAWVHEGQIGYLFPTPATVQIKRQNQTGRWSDIGAGDSATQHSNPMFTLWFDHGQQPTNASYAYAVLPGRTAAQTSALAAASPFTVLAQTSSVHAVKHTTEDAVGAVFWSAGTIDGVSVSAPCVVFWQRTGDTVQIALTEPTHANTSITMTFPASLSGVSLPAGVTSVPSGGQTLITFEVSGGTNYEANFDISSPGNTPPVINLISPASAAVTLGNPNSHLWLVAGATDAESTPDVAWTQVSGPSGQSVTFADAGAASTSVRFPASGTYVLRATANDGSLTASTDLTVHVGPVILPTASLGIHYPLDTTSGTMLTDSVGTNHATITGTDYAWVPGKLGSALTFTGNITRADTASAVSINGTTSFSAAAWIRPTTWATTATSRKLLQQMDGSGTGRSWLYISPTGLLSSFLGGVATTSNSTIPLNQWTHVALTVGGGLVKLYINGNEAASQSRTMESNTGTLRLGNAKTATAEDQFLGGLDDFRFYSRTLTPEEIAQFLAPEGLAVNAGVSPPAVAPGVAAPLAGSVSGPAVTAITWSLIGGTGSVTFENANALATTATFSSAGAYLLRLSVSDGNLTVFADLDVTVTASPFEQWQASAFLAGTPDADRLPTADPDADGLPNLLEYALGKDPANPSDPSDLTLLNTSGQYLSLTFLRARSDILYEVLASNTLAAESWTVIATDPGTVSLTEPVTVTDPVSVSDNPRRFLRLRATLLP